MSMADAISMLITLPIAIYSLFGRATAPSLEAGADEREAGTARQQSPKVTLANDTNLNSRQQKYILAGFITELL
jgi:hypothetical protein